MKYKDLLDKLVRFRRRFTSNFTMIHARFCVYYGHRYILDVKLKAHSLYLNKIGLN